MPSLPLSRSSMWALVLVATATMSVSYIDRQTLSVLAPTVTKALGMSETDYGVLASAFSIAYLVGAPPSGKLIDALGSRRTLPFAMLFWTAVAAAHAFAPTFAALFALRILLGLAEAPSFPGSAQAIHRALPPLERAKGIGVLFTGSSIGAMVAPKLATYFEGHFGWRGAFIGSALCGLVWLPVWLFITSRPAIRERLDARVPAPTEQKGEGLLTHPAVIRGLAMVLASAPTMAFLLLWAAKYLSREHGVQQSDMGRYLWLPPLLYDLGSIAFGQLAARRASSRLDGAPDRPLVVISMLLTCTLALMPLATSVWGAVVVAGVAMGGGGGLYALLTADLLSRVPARSVSTASGLCAAGQSITHIIVNPLIGVVLDRTGSYAPITLGLSLWVLPGCLFWLLTPSPPLHREVDP